MQNADRFVVENFQLASGQVMPSIGIVYKTLGHLNDRKDNAVLVTVGFSGTLAAGAQAFVGPGRAVDPATHFVVIVNLTGNGLSTSPSNSPAPFDRARFPKITIEDNVRLQHLLITEKLGIEKLSLVVGWSMGAAQALHWGVLYGGDVTRIAAVAGSARTATYNKIFLNSLRLAIETDPHFDGGYYMRPPLQGLKAFSAIYAGWGLSEPFYRNEVYRSLGSLTYQDFIETFWEPQFIRCDANDLLSQLWMWENADISDNRRFSRDFRQALSSITARTLLMPVDHDRYFPPEDAEFEHRHIASSRLKIVHSVWGHYAPANEDDQRVIDTEIARLLAE